MSNADHPEAVVVGRDRAPRKRGGAFSLVPGFFYILILYIIGKYVVTDPRATLFDFLGYKLSWVEVLLVAAAVMAMVEQIKVAKPGINNTTEGPADGIDRHYSGLVVRTRRRQGASACDF